MVYYTVLEIFSHVRVVMVNRYYAEITKNSKFCYFYH